MKTRAVLDETITQLRAIPEKLSGDDSPLADPWEEIKDQVQHEKSFFWGAYVDTMEAIVNGLVSRLSPRDRLDIVTELDVSENSVDSIGQAVLRELLDRANDEEIEYAPFTFKYFRYSIDNMTVYAEVSKRTGLFTCDAVAYSQASPLGEQGEVDTGAIESILSANEFAYAKQQHWPLEYRKCRCLKPPFKGEDYDVASVGIDETNGRYGDVEIETCKHCGQKWLRYFVEYEGFTKSGRWYRGILTPEMQQLLTPENAVQLLESLPAHFYGGSFFMTAGAESSGSISVDLF